MINPGLAATVQDLGRPGHRGFRGAGGRGRSTARRSGWPTPCSATPATPRRSSWTMVGGRYRATGPARPGDRGGPVRGGGPVAGRTARPAAASRPSFSMGPGDGCLVGGCPDGAPGLSGRSGAGGPRRSSGSRSSEGRLGAGRIAPAGPGIDRRPDGPPLDDFPEPGRRADPADRRARRPGPAAVARWSTIGSAAASDRVGLRLDGPGLDGLEVPGRASAPGRARGGAGGGGTGPDPGRGGGDDGRISARRPRDLGRPRPTGPGPARGSSFGSPGSSLAEACRLDRERRRELAARDRRIAVGAGPGGPRLSLPERVDSGIRTRGSRPVADRLLSARDARCRRPPRPSPLDGAPERQRRLARPGLPVGCRAMPIPLRGSSPDVRDQDPRRGESARLGGLVRTSRSRPIRRVAARARLRPARRGIAPPPGPGADEAGGRQGDRAASPGRSHAHAAAG